MLTGVVYAIAAAQLMKMIYVSSAHQATNTAEIDLASSLYHDYVSLHFFQREGWSREGGREEEEKKSATELRREGGSLREGWLEGGKEETLYIWG